jgi:hypothetical protein
MNLMHLATCPECRIRGGVALPEGCRCPLCTAELQYLGESIRAVDVPDRQIANLQRKRERKS